MYVIHPVQSRWRPVSSYPCNGLHVTFSALWANKPVNAGEKTVALLPGVFLRVFGRFYLQSPAANSQRMLPAAVGTGCRNSGFYTNGQVRYAVKIAG